MSTGAVIFELFIHGGFWLAFAGLAAFISHLAERRDRRKNGK